MEERAKIEKNTFLKLVMKNKVSTLLILIIITLLLVIGFKSFEQSRLIKAHELSLKNLKIESNQELSAVFTLAVRSELMRSNTEGVSQLFLSLLKNQSISKIQLIDPETQKVVLSTDKKNEGEIITDQEIVNIKNQKKIETESSYKIIVPVMGIDRIIGIISIDFIK